MKNQKILIIVLSVVAVVALAATVTVIVVKHHKETPITVIGEIEDFDTAHATNKHYTFDDENPTADSALLGKWQNTDNKQWYKVYYDDYDEDGFFWGKEWDESEDVMEQDLKYHGNGWFRWRREGKELHEMAMQDEIDVPISKFYFVGKPTEDELILTETYIRQKEYRFQRAVE